MIYGDPFYFALQFEVVEAWSVPGDIWENGVFSLYIEGVRVFGVVDVFELRTTFGFYSKSSINNLMVNDLHIDSEVIYKNARDYFIGDSDFLIDGLFDMTCTAMGDNGYYLYFVNTSSGDRLVWTVDRGDKIHETILPLGTVADVIDKLQKKPL